MTITSAIVLFSVFWFIILCIILPLNVTTQKDVDNIVPGTAPSSPVNSNLRRKFFITSIITLLVWIPACFGINFIMP